MLTVVEKLFENAKRNPDKLAVIFENEEVTYCQLKDSTVRLANWFKTQGIEKGDRIVVQAAHCKWYIAACFASHLCGAIFVPVEKTLTEKTLEDTVKRLEAKAVVSRLAPSAHISLNYSDIDAKLAGVEEEQPWQFPELEMVANIMLTSGTTGIPKGAILTQKNLAANCLVRLSEIEISESDVGITFIPLNHVACERVWETAIYIGSTYIMLDGMIKMNRFYEFIDKYNVNTFNMPPSGIASLENLSQSKLYEYAEQIDYICIQSAPIQEPQRRYLKAMLPKSKLFYVYGSTETGTATIRRLDEDQKDIRCVGRACEGVDIRIWDNNMQDVAYGVQGRVAIRDDMNCKGYWGMPEVSKDVYYDEFFLTNDLGYLDENGFLYILGRIDDVINVGGLKLLPSEVEKATMEITGIDECLCYDVPNAVTGRAVKLLVRLAEDSRLSASDIRAALAVKLDNYKVPSVIEFVPEIMKNPNGKPDRRYYYSREGGH